MDFLDMTSRGLSRSRSMVRVGILQILPFVVVSISASAESNNRVCETLPAHSATYTISKEKYQEQLQGFWLGQSIANWTGIVTEMVRVQEPFYTSKDWGSRSEPSVWGFYAPHSSIIDFYIVRKGSVWGADDDTDIEYMYQYLLEKNDVDILTSNQITEGWKEHIYSNEEAPISPLHFNRENYLWVSNEKALELMSKGVFPPETSDPVQNQDFDKIDAQLTTEIFGVFSPARPDVALRLAHLPVRTTARQEAAWIAEFYIVMHALASSSDPSSPLAERLMWIADNARAVLPETSYASKMYDFVKSSYLANPDKLNWELTRDAVYERYQKNSHDGYVYKQPYDAGINFAASLVSLFYGAGDIKKTIKIGTLTGWDSDNPTATWGGLLGFLIGKEGIEEAFDVQDFAEAYWIHRTRRNFPDRTPSSIGEDMFSGMASRALKIVDGVVMRQMNGRLSSDGKNWIVPVPSADHCRNKEESK